MIVLETLIEKLKNRCQADLPGELAQANMLAKPRNSVFVSKLEEKAIPSAVLILLYQDSSEIQFILTERTHDVQHHKGQISLPGGSWEKGEHLYETAIRETNEEIGIHTNKIKFTCELTPLFVKVTGYMIHPFVGYINENPTIIPQINEVSNVFTVTISELLDAANQHTELWTIRDNLVDVPFFKFGEYKVWGATAMILSEFRQCIQGII